MCIEDIFFLSFPNIYDFFLSFCMKDFLFFYLFIYLFWLKEFKMFSFWWLKVEITFMILVLLVWFKAYLAADMESVISVSSWGAFYWETVFKR